MISRKLSSYNIKVVANDIQYQEGILEYLETNKNVNYLIMDERIPGNFKTQELVFNIKKINNKIKIILISNNEENINVYKKIKEASVEKICNIINSENVFNKPSIPINNFFKENTKEGEITTVLGPNGIGKSIFSIVFAKQSKNIKIAIIDFDILNNNLHTLLGVKQYSNTINSKLKKNNYLLEKINIKDFIIHTKYNIDLFSGINLIFNSKTQSSASRIKNIIKSIKNEYDLILIDTASDCLLEYTRELVKISDSILFISGANLLEIKKSKKLLDIYDKEWKIKKEKINIIFNKCTNKSVDDEVLRRVFKKYNILGKIQLSDYYDLAINKNDSKINQIKKDISNINKKYKLTKNKALKIKKIKR